VTIFVQFRWLIRCPPFSQTTPIIEFQGGVHTHNCFVQYNPVHKMRVSIEPQGHPSSSSSHCMKISASSSTFTRALSTALGPHQAPLFRPHCCFQAKNHLRLRGRNLATMISTASLCQMTASTHMGVLQQRHMAQFLKVGT
jgi:hypothetical protein